MGFPHAAPASALDLRTVIHTLPAPFFYGRVFFLRQNNRRPFQAMALMSAILSQLVGSVLIGIFSGRWLDRNLGTEPLFLILSLLIGLAAGVYAMLRLVQHFFSGE